MIKTKDDSFLGDDITNNIKFGDNVWQAHGTVDRGSVYTKEPILNLLFEHYNFDNNIGDYTNYVARASTGNLSTSDSENTGTSQQQAYSVAKLQHDLYLIDSRYYSISSSACVTNIFAENYYLKKAIAISNPVYDSNAKVKTINLLGITRNGTKFNYTNPALGNITLRKFFSLFAPQYFNNETVSDSYFSKILERYLVVPDTDKQNSSSASDLNTYSLGNTLNDFLERLAKYDYYLGGKNFGNVADLFLKDFELNIHSSDSIRLPFELRKNKNQSTENISDKIYRSRFIINSVSQNLYANLDSTTTSDTVTTCTPIYLESVNDLYESYLIDDNTDLSKSYAHLFEDASFAETEFNNKVRDLIETSGAASNIAKYCVSVYSGYSTSFTPNQSWGIHFINEEPTENLFQDEDESYKLYSSVLIGYRLADMLMCLRTTIGGFYELIYEGKNNNSEKVLLPLSIPLNKRLLTRSYFDLTDGSLNNTLDCYPTISIINKLYKLGHVANETIDTTLPNEVENDSHAYDFADEIKEWLREECFIFKGNVYGDFVEELNFLQDLTPDSDVNFNSLKIKKTETVTKKYQESKYEVPYVEQTIPLINHTLDNKPTDGNDFELFGSNSIAATGNLIGTEIDGNGNKTRNVLPPFIYDVDKGDQSSYVETADERTGTQQYNSKNYKGQLTVEDRITSPTIDELWAFLKYLTESDGSDPTSNATGVSVNEKLPSFYGLKKANLLGPLGITSTKTNGVKNRVNKKATSVASTGVIDILNWKPVTQEEPDLDWSPTSGEKIEYQFKGYEVTNYIEKVYDYEVKPFSRSAQAKKAQGYEYDSTDKGYLEKLWNSVILAFDVPEIATSTGSLFGTETETIRQADALAQVVAGKEWFSSTQDSNFLKATKPTVPTTQRTKALLELISILNYTDSDSDKSKHVHFKEYLDNPKNLKEIERDLETIRQNLQTLSEYSIATFANLGYFDRAQNRGTLHQLHKNAYNFDSTFIDNVNNAKATKAASSNNYSISVELNSLTTDLNNTEDTLNVDTLDRRVVFEDGDYTNRYLRENYDSGIIDLNNNVTTNSRATHMIYRPNETLLSEVYLAADGTWRSVHEHVVLPVVYDEH